ncbi:MAG: nucleoside phosphorylase [Proteobacteria bacterium]|nr:MAG: nucleoside phosphorylase [Pseudomonadota bacterium]
MKLIHTALLCEAQPIIEKLRLQKMDKNIYNNDEFILTISGIGEEKTKEALNAIFSSHKIKKAINIGIAGCKDKNIPIGKLFCINEEFENIPKASITSVSKPRKDIKTLLADMETSAFKTKCEKFHVPYLIFKIVSDHLDATIPKKAFVSSLIRESLDKWIKLV